MIKNRVFSKEYVLEIKEKYRVDPSILERAIYALGLVEALVISGLEFIFKGGSSLMIMLERPLRLSTDVDIIVDPKTDIIAAIEKASVIYPFLRYEEDERKTTNNIKKRHFVFYYKSIWKEDKETPILLDVLFEDNHYPNLLRKEAKTEFVETKGENVFVNIPTPESLLGDKLTAFAPKTIGIRPITEKDSGKIIDKRVETIKQFFDVASLFDVVTDFEQVKRAYIETAKTELGYRDIGNLSYKDCLKDTYEAALSIISKGRYLRNDYVYYLDGIRGLTNFLINVRFNAETAYIQASKVMYLCACFLANKYPVEIEEIENLVDADYAKNINNIRKIDLKSFNMAARAIKLFKESI